MIILLVWRLLQLFRLLLLLLLLLMHIIPRQIVLTWPNLVTKFPDSDAHHTDHCIASSVPHPPLQILLVLPALGRLG